MDGDVWREEAWGEEPLPGWAQSRLLALFSPSFPTGGFSYSHGFEALVESGAIGDRRTLTDWIEADLREGPGWCDALLLAASWRAARAGEEARLLEVAELAAALRGTAELASESLAQGRAFLNAAQGAWPVAETQRLAARLRDEAIALTLPVAVALVLAGQAIALVPGLVAFLHGSTANLVSAGLRLIPLGQSDGLKATAELEPLLVEVAREAASGDLDRLGSSMIALDLASMAHETQYTRLFRS